MHRLSHTDFKLFFVHQAYRLKVQFLQIIQILGKVSWMRTSAAVVNDFDKAMHISGIDLGPPFDDWEVVGVQDHGGKVTWSEKNSTNSTGDQSASFDQCFCFRSSLEVEHTWLARLDFRIPYRLQRFFPPGTDRLLRKQVSFISLFFVRYLVFFGSEKIIQPDIELRRTWSHPSKRKFSVWTAFNSSRIRLWISWVSHMDDGFKIILMQIKSSPSYSSPAYSIQVLSDNLLW